MKEEFEMMTSKQKWFINKLMVEVEELGIDPLEVGGVRSYLLEGEYLTTSKMASQIIQNLLEAKENAPKQEVKKENTKHIKNAVAKLLNGKRKNKDETVFAIQRVIGRGLNKSTVLTDDELLNIEEILKDAGYIK